jgi:hypothetical protein
VDVFFRVAPGIVPMFDRTLSGGPGALDRGRSSRARLLARVCLSAGGLAVCACVPAGDGVAPPSERIYFPVGVATDVKSDWLYVINSDFDLQFNQGTVQSLSLERVREVVPRVCDSESADAPACPSSQICDDGKAFTNDDPSYFCVDSETDPKPCGDGVEAAPSERALAPGRCKAFSPSDPPDGGPSVISQTVEISAFATDVLFAKRPPDAPAGPPERLFIPVRGDSTLHWIDADDGRLDCGQGDSGRCSDSHRLGDNESANDGRGVDLPVEPFGISATADGRVVAVTHQTSGSVSSFINDWENDPSLQAVESGLPSRPIGIASIPVNRSTSDHYASFLVGFRNNASVHLLQFFDDGVLSEPPPGETLLGRPSLIDVGSTPITLNSLGYDSRGMAVDGSKRELAVAACKPEACDVDDAVCVATAQTCVEAAEVTPVDVYLTNRTPPSLLVGQVRTAEGSDPELPIFYDNVPLTAGPSRVVVGHVTVGNDAAGDPIRETRIFVLCFDSSLIFIYDPARRRVETEIFTGRGPYSMAFDDKDPERPMAYIGHFTDSFIGVVSLDQRTPRTYGTFITTIGAPTPPRASK